MWVDKWVSVCVGGWARVPVWIHGWLSMSVSRSDIYV